MTHQVSIPLIREDNPISMSGGLIKEVAVQNLGDAKLVLHHAPVESVICLKDDGTWRRVWNMEGAEQFYSTVGEKLIELLNDPGSAEIEVDVLYGWIFKLDREERIKDATVIHFDIEYGHYIKGHKITLHDNGSSDIHLEDPFWGCGADEEIALVINHYLTCK